jgi:hypothetical protein
VSTVFPIVGACLCFATRMIGLHCEAHAGRSQSATPARVPASDAPPARLRASTGAT